MAKKVVKSTKSQKGNPALLSAAVVGSSVVVAPVAYYVTGMLSMLLVVPAVVSLLVAFMYRGYVGSEMTYDFRRETTTMVAVFSVILIAVLSVSKPVTVGLPELAGAVGPIFMVLYRSLVAIVATAVAVYLPLSITVKK